jgi:hypothetical protein
VFRADVAGGGTSAPAPAVPRAPAIRPARRPALERRPGATRSGDPQRLPLQGTDRYQEPLDDRGDRGSSRGAPTIAVAAGPGSTLPAPPSAGERPQSLAALVRLWQDETAAPDALPQAPEAVSPPVPTEPASPREAARPTLHAEGRRAADASVPELLAVPVAAPLAPAVAEAAYATSPLPVASFAPPIAEAAYATSPPPVATSAASASVTLGPGPAASASDARPHRDAALASDDAAPDVEHAVERLLLSELRRHGIELE